MADNRPPLLNLRVSTPKKPKLRALAFEIAKNVLFYI